MQSRVPWSEFIASFILMLAIIAATIALGVATAEPYGATTGDYEHCTRMWNTTRCD